MICSFYEFYNKLLFISSVRDSHWESFTLIEPHGLPSSLVCECGFAFCIDWWFDYLSVSNTLTLIHSWVLAPFSFVGYSLFVEFFCVGFLSLIFSNTPFAHLPCHLLGLSFVSLDTHLAIGSWSIKGGLWFFNNIWMLVSFLFIGFVVL